jgi:hypothetical protein
MDPVMAVAVGGDETEVVPAAIRRALNWRL